MYARREKKRTHKRGGEGLSPTISYVYTYVDLYDKDFRRYKEKSSEEAEDK